MGVEGGCQTQAYFVMPLAYVGHESLCAARDLGVGQQDLDPGHPAIRGTCELYVRSCDNTEDSTKSPRELKTTIVMNKISLTSNST